MKKKVIGLLFFIFLIMISNHVFGITIGVGEEHTFTFTDLTENGNVPNKITNASKGNEIILVEEEKTGIWPFRAISGIKVKGLKAGTTTITINGQYDTYTIGIDGTQTTQTNPISKTFTIEVRDYLAEAEKEKENTDNAYKTEPGVNADAKTIKNFIISDQKYNDGKNLKKVSVDKLNKWLTTVDAYIATDRAHYGQDGQYGGVKSALEDMINNGEVSDENKKKLDETYNITNSSNERVLAAYKSLSGEKRQDVFNDDVLDDIDAYDPSSHELDGTSASRIENVTSKILTVISNIGIAVSVIMLAVLGIKYMLGSVEEKAEYKEGLIPYVIGAFILFGITGFIKILIAIGDKIGNL